MKIDVRIIGAGRTDAGVHASGQTANFRSPVRIPPAGLKRALNGALPSDISVRSAEIVPDTFHARFDALSRTYEYTILNRPEPSALLARYVWNWGKRLSAPVWSAMCAELVGEFDFASFQKTGGSTRSTVRRIHECVCFREGGLVKTRVKANGFLRGMVRAMVGTFRWIAPDESVGKAEAAERLRAVLAARGRSAAGPSAPARGLCLVNVDYATEGNELSFIKTGAERRGEG